MTIRTPPPRTPPPRTSTRAPTARSRPAAEPTRQARAAPDPWPGGGNHPRRSWPFVLAIGLIVLLAGSAGYVAWFTSVLGLRTVTVAGVDEALTTDIRAEVDRADPPGTPLIRIDPVALRARIEGLPDVAAASVTRAWPDGLIVSATARTAVAVTSANGALWLLDSTGHAYRRVAAAPTGLVTVELGTPGPGDPATLAALQVVGEMTAEFRAEVATVRAGSPFDIRITLADGRSVIWGSAQDGARKMQVIGLLLTRDGRIFDISDPTSVAVR